MSDFYNDQAAIKAELDNNHTARLQRAAKNGESEGRINQPTPGQTFTTEHEQSLFQEYTGDLSELQQKLGGYLETHHNKWVNYRKEIAEVKKDPDFYNKRLKQIKELETTELKNIESAFDRELHVIENEKKPITVEYDDATAYLETIQEKVGRTELNIALKSRPLYYIILSMFGFAEIPINFKTFEQFRESTTSTYLIALTLIVGVPIVSHFAGMGIKQKDDPSRKFVFRAGNFLIGIISMLGGVGSINREFVVKGVPINFSFTTEFGNFLEANSSEIIFFFFISILIFVVGILASYSHHDQSYELEAAYKKWVKAQKRYEKKIEPLEEKSEQLNNEVNIRKKETESKYFQARVEAQDYLINLKDKLSETIGEYDKFLSILQGMEKEIAANYITCVTGYRRANMRSRPNGKQPKCFAGSPGPLELIYKDIPELDDNKKAS